MDKCAGRLGRLQFVHNSITFLTQFLQQIHMQLQQIYMKTGQKA